MNDTVEFKSLRELYDRVSPALYSKVKEVRNLGFKYITEKDIWNYLVEKLWKNKVNLELHELISDIINCDNLMLNDYVMNILNSLKDKEDIITDKENLM